MATPAEKTPLNAEQQAEWDLLAKAIAGDESALEELLVSRHEQLLHYVHKQIPPELQAKVDADDLLQQTYLQVFKSIERFDPRGPGAFFAWLKTIASNKLIDATRKSGRENQVGQSPAPAAAGEHSGYLSLLGLLSCSEAGPGGQAMAEELRGAFHVALANLPSNYREVIQLRYLEDLPMEEVAQRLGVSSGAARGLCHRARQSLRDEIMRLSRFI